MTREDFFAEHPNVVVYDFEVFLGYWLLVLIDALHPDGLFIDTVKALKQAYNDRKDFVWAGYNSKNYDRFIFGALYNGKFSNLRLYEFSKSLITNHAFKGKWRYLIDGMKSYDVAGFAMQSGIPKYSLKQLEGLMGHSIQESTIPWDYTGEFSEEQKEETRHYCLHDVRETLEILLRTEADFTAQADIISTFSLGEKAWSMTKAQLTAEVLHCRNTVTTVVEDNGVLYDVEETLDFSGEEWSNFILPCVDIQRYDAVFDFFSDAENYKSSQKLELDIMGVSHVLGLGGIHGARRKYHQKGNLLHIDVTSYYPSLMIEWGLLTRRTNNPELFREIYNKRIALKRAGKKREQQPYKIIINAAFGISNDKYSTGYDPCRNHEVCINGQLMLVMLLERLEGHCDLIQSNTDGLIISYDGYDRKKIIEICKSWENETRMSLDYDEITEIWQKDVNNYMACYETGACDLKGAYVKTTLTEVPAIAGDVPILGKAVKAGLEENSSDAVRRTIEACTDLADFQKICKIGSSYQHAYLGDEELSGHRCFRVFAVKDGETLYKKKEGKNKEKVANTAEKVCVVYDDLRAEEIKDSSGVTFSIDRLDLDYYIDTAIKQYKAMMPEQ